MISVFLSLAFLPGCLIGSLADHGYCCSHVNFHLDRNSSYLNSNIQWFVLATFEWQQCVGLQLLFFLCTPTHSHCVSCFVSGLLSQLTGFPGYVSSLHTDMTLHCSELSHISKVITTTPVTVYIGDFCSLPCGLIWLKHLDSCLCCWMGCFSPAIL